MPFPDIDPIAFSIGPIDVRWYGLAYVAALFIGTWYAERLVRRHPDFAIAPGTFDGFFTWALVAILVGGRLGSILLYNFDYYLANPWKIFATHEGGMAFHGGFAGVVIAAIWFCRRRRVSLLAFSDVLACVAPIGLFLGRIANFINGELWGRPSTAPWAVIFPNPAAGGIPRHPSQLYEAALEGVLLFLVLNAMALRPEIRRRHGLLAAGFLLGYALVRMAVEFTREPDAPLIGPLTRGQAYSLPMLVAGIVVVALAFRSPKTPASAAAA